MSEITERRLASLTVRYKSIYPDTKIDWLNFANWLNSFIRPYIIPSSWQAYSHAFKSVCPSDEALDLLRGTKSPPRSEIQPRGSRLRKKSLHPLDMEALEKYSKIHHNSSWGLNAIVWLKCGILTGLRPHEWQYAYIDGEYNLVVDNLKLNQTTESTWSPRVIPLAHLSSLEISMIRKWIETITALSSIVYGYPKFIKGCQQWLLIANKRIWKRRTRYICLMSARHQFIANLKINNFTPVEIAYLVGHANDMRSYESYGPTSNGVKGISLPDSSNIPQEDFDKISLKLDKIMNNRTQSKDKTM